jgi:hypothetical protein
VGEGASRFSNPTRIYVSSSGDPPAQTLELGGMNHFQEASSSSRGWLESGGGSSSFPDCPVPRDRGIRKISSAGSASFPHCSAPRDQGIGTTPRAWTTFSCGGTPLVPSLPGSQSAYAKLNLTPPASNFPSIFMEEDEEPPDHNSEKTEYFENPEQKNPKNTPTGKHSHPSTESSEANPWKRFEMENQATGLSENTQSEWQDPMGGGPRRVPTPCIRKSHGNPPRIP